MISLYEELRAIVQILNEADIPHALVGGLAYSLWVETRATEDIDLLIMREDWDRIPEMLEPLGYLSLAAPMDFSNVSIRRLTKIEERSALVVDFLLADSEPLKEGIARARKIEYMGRVFSVASPETIILLKEGRMSSKDKNDIEGLRKLREGADR